MPERKKIAIIGRPNVGKSQLFNAIAKKRIAIVDDNEGTTRDRLIATVDFFGQSIDIIDTGGIEFSRHKQFHKEITEQALHAIEEADSIILVVDGRAGMHEFDREIATICQRTHKPLCVAANKIDSEEAGYELHQFYALGIDSIVPISAIHGYNIAELLEQALEPLGALTASASTSTATKIAIFGRPNVGKSTLFNALIGQDRSIVSPIAGTTRDVIDEQFSYNGENYCFIDTAGLKRRHKEHEVVEKFATIRTKEALEKCDIALVVAEAAQGITTEEKKILALVNEAEKGCIILINKWDAVKNFRMEHCLQGLEEELPFTSHIPKLFISAKTGRNVMKIFPEIAVVAAAFTARIPTPKLNKWLEKALQAYHPPMIQGKRLRIYYGVQIDTAPPRFALFVNNPMLFDPNYKKYLMNELKANFNLTGTPVLLQIRPKQKRQAEFFD